MAKSRDKGAGRDWKLFSVRLSPEHHKYLDAHQLSKADLLRMALDDHMEKNGG